MVTRLPGGLGGWRDQPSGGRLGLLVWEALLYLIVGAIISGITEAVVTRLMDRWWPVRR